MRYNIMKIPLTNIPKLVYFTHVPHGKIKLTYIYEVLSIVNTIKDTIHGHF